MPGPGLCTASSPSPSSWSTISPSAGLTPMSRLRRRDRLTGVPLRKHLRVDMTLITAHTSYEWVARFSNHIVWKSTSEGSANERSHNERFSGRSRSTPGVCAKGLAPGVLGVCTGEPVQKENRRVCSFCYQQGSSDRALGTLCLDCLWNEPLKTLTW